MRYWLFAAVALPIIAAPALLSAAAPALPPPGAEGCTVCHVQNGGVGVLIGKPAQDTVLQMEAYRSGTQPATIMNRIVRGFTPDEVIALAAWFSGQGHAAQGHAVQGHAVQGFSGTPGATPPPPKPAQ